MNSVIVSQTPAWYIFLCLGLGFVFSVLYYFKAKIFSRNQKLIMALIRCALGFCVSYLLLNPLIKTVTSFILKPKVVVLVDNSKSMLSGGDLKDAENGLEALSKDIRSKGYDLEIKNLEDSLLTALGSSSFKNKKTNLSAALHSIKNNNEGQNLSDVILFSDGIINDGISPTFSKYPFNVHAIGHGDTTLKRDAFIKGISANKLAYLGNNFLVSVDVGAYLLKGQNPSLTILDDKGEVLAEKKISYTSDDSFQTVSFEIPAKVVGKQRYQIKLQSVTNEHTIKNNSREFIVDVVNGKEKILLLAYAPHPDIKAIKSIIERNEHFDLNLKIVQESNVHEIAKEDFDILILHQFPDVDNFHLNFIGGLLAKQKPTFFILGSKSNISYFNGMQNVVGINAQAGKVDKVTAMINPAFGLFTYSENQAGTIANFPPVSVPFGSYILHGGSNVILDQYVSGINASRPLMAVNLSGSRKMAVFVAEGLWQWRLEEFAVSQNQEYLDDLITKTLQLISVKEDKGKLRVYPISDVFDIDQRVTFAAEVYNEIFQRIYNQDIRLTIKPQKGVDKVFEFKITEGNSRFELPNLPVGVYNYEATSKVLGKEEVSSGQFVVSDTDVEMQNTVADFGMLRTLANENNGDFVTSSNIIELRNSLEKKGLINKVMAQEELKDLINLRWLMFIILALASLEWILRKYFGSY
jgi:hypothetical protein